MTTHFIEAEIDLQASPKAIAQAVEAQLQQQGEPLRWAITAVDREQQTATVEAIVTTPDITAPDITAPDITAPDSTALSITTPDSGKDALRG